MPDLNDVSRFLEDEHGLAVVSTASGNGRILSSVVNAGVATHPVTGADVVALISGGSAARLRHIRLGSEVNVTVRRGWQWAGVAGTATVIGPDYPADGFDADRVRLLIRDVFMSAGGTHDDFDEFDRVMLEDRRAAVFVEADRIIGNT